MGDSKTITVSTEGGDVVVRKLALAEYAALLRALKKLPTEFGKFIEGNDSEALKDTSTLFTVLPQIIADSIPEFCEVLSVVSDKDQKFFEEGDLADALECFVSALEVNNYEKIVKTIKKLMARKPAKAEAKQIKTQ